MKNDTPRVPYIAILCLVSACRMELELGTDRDGSPEAAALDGEDRAPLPSDTTTADRPPPDARLDAPVDVRDAGADIAPETLGDAPGDTVQDAPGVLDREAVDAPLDARPDVPEVTDVPADGGLAERGAPCTRDSECRTGMCHPTLRRCGERCDRGIPTPCPAGTTCVIPGDIAGVCMETCTSCTPGACRAGFRCATSRLGEPTSPTACIPEEFPQPRPVCATDGGVDASCACGPESCGTAVCGRSPCGYLCGTCPSGSGCFMGRCTTTCPGTPCVDVSGHAVCEGGRGAVRCPSDSSAIRLCTCSGGGPNAWISCAAGCTCSP